MHAVTVEDPRTASAGKAGAVATPVDLLIMGGVPRVILFPETTLVGAVNVTVLPDTPLPPESFTVADNTAKAVLTGTVWGVPLVAATVAGVPERLVSEK